MKRAFNIWLCFAFDFSQGLNGQKKYQIHLKSTSGPIDVLLVNKDAWSSPPVVLPVPPPEDLIQCQAVAPSKPQIPPLTHFQEASVPSSTQPSTPTPTSTQDHSPPVQKATSTGEREAMGGRNRMVAEKGEYVPWPGWGWPCWSCSILSSWQGRYPCLCCSQPFLLSRLVGLAVLTEMRHLA